MRVFRNLFSGSVVFATLLALNACGYGKGYSYSSLSGYMTGEWDFIFTNSKGKVPFVIETLLNQDHHGIISATGSVNTNGPSGNVITVFISGGSLSATRAVFLDYLGFTCNGSDTGDRSITGSINPSNQVTLNWNIGGSEVATITGTMDNSASPQFTGTYSTSGTCGGGSGTVTGRLAVVVPSGTYTGISAADSTENISLAATATNGSISGNGTDSKLGNFTLTGNTVGLAFSGTLTYASSPANNGPVFGYYDSQLGVGGSILLVSFGGVNSATCPNGEPDFQGTCEIATLALP